MGKTRLPTHRPAMIHLHLASLGGMFAAALLPAFPEHENLVADAAGVAPGKPDTGWLVSAVDGFRSRLDMDFLTASDLDLGHFRSSVGPEARLGGDVVEGCAERHGCDAGRP